MNLDSSLDLPLLKSLPLAKARGRDKGKGRRRKKKGGGKRKRDLGGGGFRWGRKIYFSSSPGSSDLGKTKLGFLKTAKRRVEKREKNREKNRVDPIFHIFHFPWLNIIYLLNYSIIFSNFPQSKFHGSVFLPGATASWPRILAKGILYASALYLTNFAKD